MYTTPPRRHHGENNRRRRLALMGGVELLDRGRSPRGRRYRVLRRASYVVRNATRRRGRSEPRQGFSSSPNFGMDATTVFTVVEFTAVMLVPLNCGNDH
jgi:hypothetical protein